MSVETNKASMLRVFAEAVNGGEMAIINTVFAPDVIDHNPDPGQLPGAGGIIASVEAMRRSSPDLTVTIETLVGEDDDVASRETWTRTDVSLEQRLTSTVPHHFRFRNERVVEEWSAGWDWVPIADIISE